MGHDPACDYRASDQSFQALRWPGGASSPTPFHARAEKPGKGGSAMTRLTQRSVRPLRSDRQDRRRGKRLEGRCRTALVAVGLCVALGGCYTVQVHPSQPTSGYGTPPGYMPGYTPSHVYPSQPAPTYHGHQPGAPLVTPLQEVAPVYVEPDDSYWPPDYQGYSDPGPIGNVTGAANPM